ncbi:hypothetical protein [Streptomyces sp. Amel2xC10]|uniref:hypothetical protein n=1 Tax=Streptomyces sp. Amel2xC10 TaxID=1305826 RepID=UPI000A083AFE|nr:hypothetical protein [Streptomyces sp. Amel2xC10]SMF74044.1 hypothetical protein SAMN02745830_05715 [Streptomyces sp. Amel2xC10]
MHIRRTRRNRYTTTVALAVSVALGTAGAVSAMGAAQAAEARQAAAPVSVLTIQSDPTPEEQAQLREVAAAIWNPELAAGWNMNTDVAAVLSDATGEILRCSQAFALVPKPPGFVPGIGYLVSYAQQLKNYFLAVRDNRTYRACVVTAAANYRSAVELASMGI